MTPTVLPTLLFHPTEISKQRTARYLKLRSNTFTLQQQD